MYDLIYKGIFLITMYTVQFVVTIGKPDDASYDFYIGINYV